MWWQLSFNYLQYIALMGFICFSCKDRSIDESAKKQANNAEWQLVWQDEFDEREIDTTRWEFQLGDGTAYGIPGWGNNELQNYTNRPRNAYISNGCLVIQVLKETFQGQERLSEYTSARLRTKNKGDWKYGRFEIRAKLPCGKGLWPAIWLLPTDNIYGGWAASGEIDIMESLGHEPNIVYGTLHYGDAWPNNVHTGISDTLTTGNFSEKFHTFSLEWDSTAIKWFIDDTLYQTQTKWFTVKQPFPAPFDQRFHLLLNVAVGGNWPGNPDETTQFPQEMVADYVRVYQKKAVNIN